MKKLSRRQFIQNSISGAGGVVISAGIATTISGCSIEGLNNASFLHGVASGDPLKDRIIIWTRVSPEDTAIDKVRVYWEVSTDDRFNNILIKGSALTDAEKDFTIKVDAIGLNAGQTYYYRFRTVNHISAVGRMKTLPENNVEQVRLVVVSCSNYPAGYFHAFKEASTIPEVDASVHLGDYLYEYAQGEYASEDAAALNREVMPEGELISIADYRRRYAQYRTDPDLQAFHQAFPMIAIWDDHEVANDTWNAGAENHDNETEGDFFARLQAALQAYSEWMPIRPLVENDMSSLSRSFQFGDLVNLIMLDTRIVGRDKQLSMTDYFNLDGSFDFETYSSEVNAPNRSLLGTEQRAWLNNEITINAKWQVLGQQILMGKMELPGAVATAQLSIPEFAELAQIAQIAQTTPELLTQEQLAFLEEKGHLLLLPNLPYNLDAWDGYPAERKQLLENAANNQSNLVVLAGDSHNAWANNLKVDTSFGNNISAGVELATASISSPGLEDYLGLNSAEAVAQTEMGLSQLIENLQYTNLSDRGFLVVTFNHSEVKADWQYVSSIKSQAYNLLTERHKQMTIVSDSNTLS